MYNWVDNDRRKIQRKEIKSKILICDDDATLCELLGIRIDQIGCSYKDVSSCAECLDAISKDFYKVLLLDNILPDGKGIELIPRIRIISPGTKIIVMTGYEASDDKLFALNYGAGFIEKPFDSMKIIAKLQMVLSE